MRNRVNLIGNVGKDPEVRTFRDGGKVASFSLATTEKWTDRNSGERKESTDWHNIVVKGKLVDVVEKYVKKGTGLAVEGRIKYRSYDAEDGQKKYITEIIVRELLLLPKSKPAESNQATSSQAPPAETVGEAEDDLPF